MTSPLTLKELSGLSIKIPSSNPKLSYLPTSTHSAVSTYSQYSATNSPLPIDSPSTDAFTNSPYAELDGWKSPSVSYTIAAPQFSLSTPTKSHNKTEIICTTPNTINNILRNKRRTRHRRATLGTNNTTPSLPTSATPLTPTPVHDITFNFDTIDNEEEESKENKPPLFQSPVTSKTPLHVLIESDDAPNITDISSEIDPEEKETEKEESTEIVSEDALSEVRVLSHYGYVKVRKITDTLQGTVFIAMDNKKMEKSADCVVVIKRTAKVLHNKGITIQNGKEYSVNENVLKEYEVLKHFTSQQNCPTQITKALNFVQSRDNYYLVMQNAGDDFFDFIVKAHKLINENKLKIKEWRKFVKYLFYQMAVVVDWLHNHQNCCHLDISLENITVKHATFIAQKDGYFTINTNIRIKFIDFGLAEFFDPAQSFQCVKYCGKTAYKAPEIYRAKQFDARKADVWSLGVVLFCMAVGSPPYVKPSNRDDAYRYFIKTGQIEKLLFQWNRHFCVTVKMLDLLKRMMRVDIRKRYTMENVIQHQWLAVYHKQYKQYKSKRYEQQVFDHVSIYKLPENACSV